MVGVIACESSGTFFLCPLGFANGQPIYYFSLVRKRIQLVSITNLLEENKFIFIWIFPFEIV